MTNCQHESVTCLNHYETIRKYRCSVCDQVLICECDRALGMAFLPHQMTHAKETGSQRRIRVDAFAPSVCVECRGGTEAAHPRAAMRGQKTKVERYYWREIFRTKCELIADWARLNGQALRSIVEFRQEHPAVARKLRRDATRHWRARHNTQCKYDIDEETEAAFLSRVSIPTERLFARYVQVARGNQHLGRWMAPDGRAGTAEEFAADHYGRAGLSTLRCERKLVSAWVGTLLAPVIQDPTDPEVRPVLRGSTVGWRSDLRKTGLFRPLLPVDFGSETYFVRRASAFEVAFLGLAAVDLARAFDYMLPLGAGLRDYLWAADDQTVAAARAALGVLPASVVISALRWVVADFWRRQPGWPDFLVFGHEQYRFVEVKSPNDVLSHEQMLWFEWATSAQVPCAILRLSKALPRNVG